MKRAEPWAGHYFCSQRWPALAWSSDRGVLLQRVVDPVRVIVGDVIAHKPTQMLFAERNDVVQKLAAAASHPPFRDSVLPWRLNACPLRLQPRAFQKRDHTCVELRVVIQNHIPIRS